jgi:dihydrodipicolinate synthase/N-acetylneuraminate lyase
MSSKQDSFFVEEADFMSAVHGLISVTTAVDAHPIVEWVSEVVSVNPQAAVRILTVTTPSFAARKVPRTITPA